MQPNACLISLLATAISASFLDFPFSINRLNKSLHALFASFAVQAHKYNNCLTLDIPTLQIRAFPHTLDPDSNIRGHIPI